MEAFDRVIGYQDTVEELKRIASVLRDPAPYERLGAKVPNGLLISGAPGLGKTLMAQCLAEASGRPWVTLRRESSGKRFLEDIGAAFERAVEQAPSIVLLDDLDKFCNAERRGPNEPALVAVQSAMDRCRDKGVFVVATANNSQVLPQSLVRAGRFDRTIHVAKPKYEDAVLIIEHYLAERGIPNSVDARSVAQFSLSCAGLESRINMAAIEAAASDAAKVSTEDLVRACVRSRFGSVWKGAEPNQRWGDRAQNRETARRTRVACHEAGHALVTEFLSPGSVFMALVLEGRSRGQAGGIVMSRLDRPRFNPSLSQPLMDMRVALGGMVAEELVLGSWTTGAAQDLRQATVAAYDLMLCGEGGMRHVGVGVGSATSAAMDQMTRGSEDRAAERERAAADMVSREMSWVRHQLFKERDALETLAKELFERGMVPGEEVAAVLRREGSEGSLVGHTKEVGVKELVERDAKAPGNPLEVLDRDVAFTGFDLGEVGA